jgi:2-polyprenyl-3-methyl-5-hydroxy-6-metoxy-1,4-benzoquinol methylase
MVHIVDERGYNQIFRSTPASAFRLQRRAEALVREMRLPDDAEERKRVHILEIGCGMGAMAHQLAELTGARVTGVDLSERFIEEARAAHRHPNLSFAVIDLSREFPASDADRYHYIVGNGILHHLYYHLDSFFPVLSRWLAPGGRLIFWEPNLWNPYIFLIFSVPALRKLAKLEPDEMAFTARFITRKLSAAGFDPVQVATRDFLLPNTPSVLVKPVIVLGGWLEQVPLLRRLAQSVFVVATRPVAPLPR